jgi:hypothetical protein
MTNKVQKLASGVTVRTFKLPPSGFNPLEAEDRELVLYGFPARPTEDAQMFQRWKTALSQPIHLVEPWFRPMMHKQRRLPRRTRAPKNGAESFDIWSGVAIHAPAGDSFRWVEGTFTVPNAFPPVHPQDGVWYSASTWVGIDGIDPSKDVLQAGCDCDVIMHAGSLQRQVTPWWEWYPAETYWIGSIALSPGDTVHCLIWVKVGSTTEATILLNNLTSGIGASFEVTAPTGVALSGNCAEWVVERLQFDTNAPQLARYGEVYFEEAYAGTINGTTLQGGSGNVIQMVDGDNVISTGRIENSQLLQVKYSGPNT